MKQVEELTMNYQLKTTDKQPKRPLIDRQITERAEVNTNKTQKEIRMGSNKFLRVKQQNLPVTIKYPEMVAQIAPHFNGGDIPSNIGNDNLWFL